MRLPAAGSPHTDSAEQLEGRNTLYSKFALVHAAVSRRLLRDQRGQGTVEYVGLILLVSLLMVGMVAAMKGFNGNSGTEIAEVIVSKSAVSAITFK